MSGLVLFDWDDTIVDTTARMTNHGFSKAIEAVIARGWQVGLNSDTPLKRLQGWRRSLGMNGPLIAEKGAVVWWPGGNARIVSQTAELFARFRLATIQMITALDGFALFYGDNTEFIQSAPTIQGNDVYLVALDAYRICSLGLFIRRVYDGALVSDVNQAARIGHLLESLRPDHPLISGIDLNQEHCWLGVNALDTSKGLALRSLLEEAEIPAEIVMIGDSMSDYLDAPGVRHLAVANAAPAFAAVAERVASAPYTDGCIELLSAL